MYRYEQISKGHVVAVLGLKGGVGKTTIATNLAVGLATSRPELKVALVDANPLNGDLGATLNLRGEHHLSHLARIALDSGEVEHEVLDRLLLKHESGVKVLIAPHYPRYPNETGPLTGEGLLRALEAMCQHFHYVIVDTGTALDDLLSATIQAADTLLAVTEPTILALKDTRILYDAITEAGYSPADTLLIVNQQGSARQITAEQAGNFLRHPVDAVIPFDIKADEALGKAVPLTTFNPKKSPAAAALRDLARLILKRCPVPDLSGPLAAARPEQPHRPPYQHPRRSYISVMLVDDQDSIKRITQRLLEIGNEDIGADIRIEAEAANGQEAVDKARELLPDVIVMDINMPGMDGLAATRQIKAQHPSIAVIIATVHDQSEYWREAMRMGVADFIPKTTLTTDISRAIKDAYDRFQPIRAQYG